MASYDESVSDTIRTVSDSAEPQLAHPLVASDTVTTADLVSYLTGILLRESFRLGDTAAPATFYRLVVAEAARLTDLVRTGYGLAVSDSVLLDRTVSALRAVTVIEQLRLQDITISPASYRLTMAERVRLIDAAIRFFGAEAADTVSMGETAAILRRALNIVSETVTVSDSPVAALVLRVTTADRLAVGDNHVLRMIYDGRLTDAVSVEALHVTPAGSLTTWAVNTRAGAVTEYTNYTFNSFAKLGGAYIGASSTGLYELAGDDDAGQDIIADIKGGFLQFNSSRFAGLKAAYLGIRGGGEFFLKLEAASGETYTYKIVTEDMATTKVWIGKGLRHRYLSYELISTGQDFDLESIEFVPMLAQRRV